MKETLEAKGWIMYYQCNRCGGKQYFIHKDHDGYEVVARQKSKTFTIIWNKSTIAGPFHQYQLDEKLKQYVQ